MVDPELPNTEFVDTVLADTEFVEPELVYPELVDQEHVNRKLSGFADNVSWGVPYHLRNVRKYPEFKKACRLTSIPI